MDLIKLKREQIKLAKKIILKDSFEKINFIGAAERKFTKNKIISLIAIFDNNLNLIEKRHQIQKTTFPYLPEFIFYREGPCFIETFNQLENKPDLLFYPSDGILHPRNLGAASHLGLIIDTPTIGISKVLTLGTIKDKKILLNDKTIGYQLKTKEASKPIYISPGHLITLKSALKYTERYINKEHKMPEPLHIANKLVNNIKKEETII